MLGPRLADAGTRAKRRADLWRRLGQRPARNGGVGGLCLERLAGTGPSLPAGANGLVAW